MLSPTPGLEAVMRRLEKLERANRRTKQAGAAVVVVAATLFLMGQAVPHRTVEANTEISRMPTAVAQVDIRAVKGIIESCHAFGPVSGSATGEVLIYDMPYGEIKNGSVDAMLPYGTISCP